MASEETPRVRVVVPKSGCVTLSAGGRVFEVCCEEPEEPPDDGIVPWIAVEGTVVLEDLDVDWSQLGRQLRVQVE